MDSTEISNYWRLCDSFTVNQAALLIVGIDPDSEIGIKCEELESHEQPKGYGAAKRALSVALRNSLIKGENFREFSPDPYEFDSGMYVKGTTNTFTSTVDRDSVIAWLKVQGMKTGFFFPDAAITDRPDFLNPKHERFSVKLAAAVLVWQAMGDENLIGPKGLMSSMEEWLGSRYKELGLEWHGAINKSGISEAAKVANWKTTGGATKTPGR